MLLGAQLIELDGVAFLYFRQQAIALVIFGIVFTFLVDRHKTRLDQHRAIGAHAVTCIGRSCRHFDGDRIKYSRHHLARHGALPDE